MINLGIVQPDTLFLSALKRNLELIDDFDIKFQFLDGDTLLANINLIATFPDIVLIDITLPGISCINTMIMLAQSYPGTKIIAMADPKNNNKIREMMDNGADGFISRGINKQALADGIRQVFFGKIFICIDKYKQEIDRRDHLKKKSLTNKQKNFLKHCASDMPYKQIAELLHISVRTADRYRDELFHKLNVKSKVGLAMFAIRTGLAENN